MAGSFAIASAGNDLTRIPPQELRFISTRVGVIGALVSWRATQGIYEFHPELLPSLRDTPLSGDLPTELFYRLPEWCVYISTPGIEAPGKPVLGFFAFLEDDVKKPEHHELHFVLDYGEYGSLLPLGIHLGSGSVQESLDSFLAEGLQIAWRNPALLKNEFPGTSHSEAMELVKKDAENSKGRMVEMLRPMVSLTLYLCSEGREIQDADGSKKQPLRPAARKTKKGPKLFPPDKPSAWEVGYRIGEALRQARLQAGQSEGQGTHASPAPHIRRAHWHSFWMGPVKDPDSRRAVVKWLPPIPVGVKDAEDLIPTFRPVK